RSSCTMVPAIFISRGQDGDGASARICWSTVGQLIFASLKAKLSWTERKGMILTRNGQAARISPGVGRKITWLKAVGRCEGKRTRFSPDLSYPPVQPFSRLKGPLV